MIDTQEVMALQQRLSSSEDKPAYVRLYRIYYSPLLQFSLSFVKDKPAAEEIVSDVFMQLWNIREKLNTIHNLTVYLYISTRNHSLNHLRKTDVIPHLPWMMTVSTSPAPPPILNNYILLQSSLKRSMPS